MAHSLRHRGPDGFGVEVFVWASGAGVLAQRRLAIIDLSAAGRQPMSNEDGAIQLVQNGEIYNFEKLRAQLAGGHNFRSRTDTEVIVHGYEEWGEHVIEKLDGMFAIALWDARQEKLLLARDRFGKKPLFWARDTRGFYFASEIKAILAAGFKPEIASETLPEYLALGYVATPRTMFRGIHRLPPASYALVDNSLNCQPKTYWDWPMPGRGASAFRGTPAEARRAVETVLSEAVRKRLVADVPVGVLLSGGVDSTAVALHAQKLSTAPIRTFTVGFHGDPEHDERPFASLVAQCLGTNHTESVLEAQGTPTLIDTLLHHHDEPFGDSSALPTYLVSAEARRHVTVVLNGDGGDEIFAGYPRFGAALFASRIPQPLRTLGSGLIQALTLGGRVFPGGARFAGKAALPAPEGLFEWCSWFDRGQIGRLMGRQGVTRDPAASYLAAFERSEGAETLNRLLYTNARTYLLDDLIPKMDRMTMAHGLEARSPFLDTDLAVLAASLPDQYKWRGRVGKQLLKASVASHFPPGFLDRKKQGFAVPLNRWFRHELRPFLEDAIGSGSRLRQHLDGGEIDTLMKDHMGGRQDHGSRLWTLLTLQLWLDKYAA